MFPLAAFAKRAEILKIYAPSRYNGQTGGVDRMKEHYRRIILLLWGVVLSAQAAGAPLTITDVKVSAGVIDLTWTPSLDLSIVSASSSLSTDDFHFVGQVLSLNFTSLTNTGDKSFYRIRRVESVAVPDPQLHALIENAITNSHAPPGMICDIDVDGITQLSGELANIEDATGIRSLPNLIGVDLDGNALLSLDVSTLSKLCLLSCNANLMSDLVLAGCTNLQVLHCDHNWLTDLDLSLFASLRELSCNFNIFSHLDLTGCSALQSLDCSVNNFLDHLDLSGCPALLSLNCSANILTNLDLSACTNLQFVDCDDNVSLGQLTLGHSACTNVSCARGQLTRLDLQNCPAMMALNCDGNAIADLDLSGCPQLQSVSCANNGLTSLDLSLCANLESLSCNNNELTTLDLCPDSNLTYLNADNNHIWDLTPLNTQTHLHIVRLVGNPINDLSPLISLAQSGCLAGCTVFLSGPDIKQSEIDTLTNNAVIVEYNPYLP